MEKAHMDRRTKYSLRAIQNALLDILEKKDFGSISVTEVCEKADVNRGTFTNTIGILMIFTIPLKISL